MVNNRGLLALIAAPLLILALVGIRLTLFGNPGEAEITAEATNGSEMQAPPPAWVPFENALFEGWVHPDWIVGNMDLGVFASDATLAQLSPQLRELVKQNRDTFADTTVVWVELNNERTSAIFIHGCLGSPAGMDTISPEMIVETYRSLSLEASARGYRPFSGGLAPIVRLADPSRQIDVHQVFLVGRDCFTTVEFATPAEDADSMPHFEAFIANLKFRR